MHRRTPAGHLCTLVLLVLLAGWLTLAGGAARVAAQGPAGLDPLCREDGYCLPAPHLATERASACIGDHGRLR